jgi:hypothetical protein
MDNSKQCGNCLLCFNKHFNPFCIEQEKTVQLDMNCINWEKGVIGNEMDKRPNRIEYDGKRY